MIDTLEYIDTYFAGKLSAAEKAEFENKCISDPVFAEDVAFYISTRSNLKKSLYEQKKQAFQKYYEALPAVEKEAPGGVVRKMRPLVVVAAAILLFFFGYQIIFKNLYGHRNHKDLADAFIRENMGRLSVTMGAGAKDSLQLGITAFNSKEYHRAEIIFQALATDTLVGAEAIKNLGVVYVVVNDYDKAIAQFDKLAQLNLYANPGIFYKAVTLMKRGNKGDEDTAKKLLEEVEKKDLPGSKKAKEWLRDNKW